MVWPDFVLYQLSYNHRLATIGARIRARDSDVIQTGSRFVYQRRRSDGADIYTELPAAFGLRTGVEPVTTSFDVLYL